MGPRGSSSCEDEALRRPPASIRVVYRLIAELRDELRELSYDDAELVLEEFGLGVMTTDDWEFERTRELGRLLRAATDDDLVSLGSHLSSEAVEDAAQGVTRANSGSRRPLALFASGQSSHKALVGSVAAALDRYGVELFVAPEDIEPDREWKDEILEALGTTDCGAAGHPAAGKDAPAPDTKSEAVPLTGGLVASAHRLLTGR